MLAQLTPCLRILGLEDATGEITEASDPRWAFAELLTSADRGLWCSWRHDVMEQVARLIAVLDASVALDGDVHAARFQSRVEPELVLWLDGKARRYGLARLFEANIDSAFASISALVEPRRRVVALIPYADTDAHGFTLLGKRQEQALRAALGSGFAELFRPLGHTIPLWGRESKAKLPRRVQRSQVPSTQAKPRPRRKPSTVAVPDRGLGAGFRIERGRVYDGYGQPVRRAQPASFEVIDGSWQKDSQRVFFLGDEVSGLDVSTFRVIDEHFAADDDHLAYGATVLRHAELRSFEQLGTFSGSGSSSGWARDASHVWWFDALDAAPMLVRSADAASFEVQQGGFATDSKGVYSGGRRLKGANPKSWRRLPGRQYSVDRHRVYYYGDAVVDADGESFEALFVFLGRDRRRWFDRQRKVPKSKARMLIAQHMVFEGQLVKTQRKKETAAGRAGWEVTVRCESWIHPSHQQLKSRGLTKIGAPAEGETAQTFIDQIAGVEFKSYRKQRRLWFMTYIDGKLTGKKGVYLLGPSFGAWDFGSPEHRPLLDRWLELVP